MKDGRSQEDYLEAILLVEQKRGSVRSVDVAEHMNFSKPSVSKAMGLLVQEGLIEFVEGKHIQLTREGRVLAEKVYEKHRFFTDLLKKAGLAPEAASEQACLLEHALSDEAFDALKTAFLSKM